MYGQAGGGGGDSSPRGVVGNSIFGQQQQQMVVAGGSSSGAAGSVTSLHCGGTRAWQAQLAATAEDFPVHKQTNEQTNALFCDTFIPKAIDLPRQPSDKHRGKR